MVGHIPLALSYERGVPNPLGRYSHTQPSFESRHLQAESIVTIYKLMVAPGQRPHKHVTSISRSAPAVFHGRMNDDQVPRKCGYFT